MGGWGTVGAHRLMGAQMSQEGGLLPRIPMHMSSQRMERASSSCVFGWLPTAHIGHWHLHLAQARKLLEGQTFAGTSVLVAAGQGCSY